jgi:hypothetical protein
MVQYIEILNISTNLDQFVIVVALWYCMLRFCEKAWGLFITETINCLITKQKCFYWTNSGKFHPISLRLLPFKKCFATQSM